MVQIWPKYSSVNESHKNGETMFVMSFILFFYVSKVFFSNGNGEVGYNGLMETNSNKLNDTF